MCILYELVHANCGLSYPLYTPQNKAILNAFLCNQQSITRLPFGCVHSLCTKFLRHVHHCRTSYKLIHTHICTHTHTHTHTNTHTHTHTHIHTHTHTHFQYLVPLFVCSIKNEKKYVLILSFLSTIPFW